MKIDTINLTALRISITVRCHTKADRTSKEQNCQLKTICFSRAHAQLDKTLLGKTKKSIVKMFSDEDVAIKFIYITILNILKFKLPLPLTRNECFCTNFFP